MTKLLPRNKEVAQKILKAIALRGKQKQGFLYVLDGQDEYILTGNQVKQMEQLKNERNTTDNH